MLVGRNGANNGVGFDEHCTFFTVYATTPLEVAAPAALPLLPLPSYTRGTNDTGRGDMAMRGGARPLRALLLLV